MKPIARAALFIVFVLVSQASIAKMMLFGGDGHKEYLGCLDCGSSNSDSICNSFGRFGNQFSSDGLWNQFSGFGNQFASKSPWNEFSSSDEVPVVVDEAGKFYGYFTINAFRHNAVSFAANLNEVYKGTSGDLEKVREALCRAFGR